jgi:Ca2+-binding RTX toxin-like protein
MQGCIAGLAGVFNMKVWQYCFSALAVLFGFAADAHALTNYSGTVGGHPYTAVDANDDGLPESVTIDGQNYTNISPGSQFTVNGVTVCVGTAQDDGIDESGLSSNCLIWGGGGDDTLEGGTSDDHIWGGAGNDEIGGNSGDDQLKGEAGNDYLAGDAGADNMDGGGDDDDMYGGAGDDTMKGGAGGDVVSGDDGADTFDCSDSGTDTYEGGDGEDTFNGTDGDDDDTYDYGNNGYPDGDTDSGEADMGDTVNHASGGDMTTWV